MGDIVKSIEDKTCLVMGVTNKDIRDKNNKKNDSLARGYVWYILHYDYNLSVSQIAKEYNRSKRAVFYLISKTKYIVDNQSTYKKLYEKITL